MNKIISLVLLAAGVAVTIIGIHATQSIGSSLSRVFTGLPTDKAVWTVIAGGLITAIGLTMTIRNWSRP